MADTFREALWGRTAGTEREDIITRIISMVTNSSQATAAPAPAASVPPHTAAAPPSRGAFVEERVRDCIGLPAPTANNRIVALADQTASR